MRQQQQRYISQRPNDQRPKTKTYEMSNNEEIDQFIEDIATLQQEEYKRMMSLDAKLNKLYAKGQNKQNSAVFRHLTTQLYISSIKFDALSKYITISRRQSV